MKTYKPQLLLLGPSLQRRVTVVGTGLNGKVMGSFRVSEIIPYTNEGGFKYRKAAHGYESIDEVRGPGADKKTVYGWCVEEVTRQDRPLYYHGSASGRLFRKCSSSLSAKPPSEVASRKRKRSQDDPQEKPEEEPQDEPQDEPQEEPQEEPAKNRPGRKKGFQCAAKPKAKVAKVEDETCPKYSKRVLPIALKMQYIQEYEALVADPTCAFPERVRCVWLFLC